MEFFFLYLVCFGIFCNICGGLLVILDENINLCFGDWVVLFWVDVLGFNFLGWNSFFDFLFCFGVGVVVVIWIFIGKESNFMFVEGVIGGLVVNIWRFVWFFCFKGGWMFFGWLNINVSFFFLLV